jgi:Pyruvate/2-oxoacid:ferredoxin oxidoreductase delta subunit/flavodoxin
MESYQKVVIYYFSGTGNSHNVARWVAESAGKLSIAAHVYNIAHIDRNHIIPPDKNTLVIFVSPVHGFNYPPLMLHFIFRFPRGNGNILLMNTRAGMLIGKFITPGLTGCAFWLSSLLLKSKGYSIRGMIPVDLPSNWMSLHPSLNDRTVQYLHEKNREKVEKYAGEILLGKTNFRAMREIIQDLLVSPVALLYYFFGRFFIAKTFYASRDCNNCDLCVKNCPAKAIIKIDNRPYWTFKCESCMNCMSSCPKRAIETGHGFVIGIILVYSLLMPLVYRGLETYFVRLESEFLQFLLETGVYLALIAILYRLLHYALHFKFVERLVVYTSFTKFRFWGKRYKALK